MEISQKRQEYSKQYYQNNLEKWTTYRSCPCGGKYCNNTKTNHLRTRKHMLYEQTKKANEQTLKLEELERKLNIIKENLI